LQLQLVDDFAEMTKGAMKKGIRQERHAACVHASKKQRSNM
jgi:hypothetical protein